MDGVTRDYNVGHCVSSGFHWLITDTAGLNDEKDYIMSRSMSQTIGVIKNSSAILFMIDGRAGVIPEDEEWALWLRKNCAFISAEHSIGIEDVLNKIKNYAIEEEYDVDRNTNSIRIAIVGRPNSGKSTLVNNILKEDRMITGEIAGLTRDAIEIEHFYKNHKIIILDTAGLRKKSSIFADIEKMSATSTIQAINYAHVVVLLVDALIGPSKQDLSILSIATREGRGVILAVNKWDLVIDVDRYISQLRDVLDKIGDIKNVIIFPISAIHDNANKLLDKIIAIHESWNKRISTNLLNTWLQSTIMAHPPSLKRGKQ
uniref:EngA-type G domain-containing protein n=1 Tax=Biomphalaria glabrata TaxID=6526 RepID=A0A2C9KKG7_BIOGL